MRKTLLPHLPSALLLALSACYAHQTAPAELGRIYGIDAEVARERLPTTLFVPGVLGSRLVDPRGRIYWGAVMGDSASPSKDLDDLVGLALPIDGDAAVIDVHDDLRADAVLHVVEADTPLGAVSLRGYPGVLEGLASWLQAGDGAVRRQSLRDLQAGETGLGAAPYDWRVDLVASAKVLAQRVEEASAQRRAHGGDGRVDLIGHSMGTLVVRWYLMYGDADLPERGLPALTWAGAAHVRSAVLVAPPSAGSPLVLESLVEGQRVSTFLPRYPVGLVGTFPALYAMMPRVRHGAVVDEAGQPLDPLDPSVWERYHWGLLSDEADPALQALLPNATTREARLAAARDWLARMLDRAGRVQAALDVASPGPADLDLHVFLGDSRATAAVMTVGADGQLRVTRTEPGDGRVTRRSALLDERLPGTTTRGLGSPIPWDGVYPGGGEHFGIVRDPVFLDTLLYLLLQAD